MDSRTYWKHREEEYLRRNLKIEDEYVKTINGYYDYMMDQVQKEINGFYAKYAKAEGITLAEAKKRASELDIEEYGRKAARYVKEKNFSEQANEEMRLYNATMKINRLEMLKANIGLELVDGFDGLQKYFDQILTDRTLDEFERQAGILGKTIQNNAQAAHAIVNASFHNAKFSDRIWMYQDMLKSELDTLLRQGLIQGRNPRVLARHLTKLFGVSKANAERLMRTELARVQIEAQKQSFERNGYDQYEFIALGSACGICRELDGKHFKIKDMEIAKNAPPCHPNCRCSVAAWEDDEEYEEWIDFLEKGGTTEEWNKVKLKDSTDKWAKEARRELLKSEKSFGSRSKETMEVYGPGGEYRFSKRGDTSSVSISVLDIPKLRGAVVTHNHPSGGSFSFTDLKFLKRMPVSEIRVSTSNGSYYIRKPEEWPQDIGSTTKMERAYNEIRNNLKPKYRKLYNDGKISKIDRHKLFLDEVNRTFAERYGFEYGFETYE
ncbi:minor capsid protein [[Clostridium] scindens]|uniref:minor capsid protein n=1 Tax=Clostridium scindens (strain JCM 10418 / VPI 12708) TaxID=29347 RepID=UPI0039A30541